MEGLKAGLTMESKCWETEDLGNNALERIDQGGAFDGTEVED